MRYSAISTTALVLMAAMVAADATSALAKYEVHLRSGTIAPGAVTDASESYIRQMPDATGHVLLQPFSKDDREALERAGVEFLQYVPDDTWLVRAPLSAFVDHAVRSRIRWSEPLAVGDRLDETLIEVQGPNPRSVRIRFHSDVDLADVLPLVEALGASVHYVSDAFHSVEALVDHKALERIGVLDEVFRVTPSVTPEANNDGVREATGAAVVFDPPYGLDGTGIIVAQWDAGIPNAHVDLSGRVFPQEDTNPGGHATQVAGVLIGDGTNSFAHGGTPLQWMGVAPNAHLLSWDYCGTGAYDEPLPPCDANSILLDQHEDALLFGATVSNNSWNAAISDVYGNCSWLGDYDYLAPDYDEVAAGLFGQEMTIVFATGNKRGSSFCGYEAGEPNYGVVPPPATAKNIISVGAISSNTETMTSFSSWGPTDDGRLKPEIVAPGSQSGGDEGVTTTYHPTPVDGYKSVQGTSFSAPAVSGCIALLQQSYSAQYGSGPAPSLTRALLVNTANDLSLEGPDYATGYGAIDIRAAVDQSEAGAFASGSVADGGTQLHTFSVASGQSAAKVTLAWTDPAGSPIAQKALVNDLDLVLVDPQGANHFPWVLDKNAPQAPADRGVNDVDVQEQVYVDNPIAGVWTAKVLGAVNEGSSQDYHLAIYDPGAEVLCSGNVLQVPSQHATIQSAIDAASDCDVIQVAAGHYSESLSVDKALTIEGAGASAQTILWPPFGQRAVHATADLTISGFDIRYGQALGTGHDGFGGAIFSEAGDLSVSECLIAGGSASLAGGAIADLGGALELTECTINGSANVSGGAVYIQLSSRARIEGCFILDSSAGGSGGGISVSYGCLELIGNSLVGNVSGTQGGAVESSGTLGGIYLANNIFASNSSASGGGVYSVQGGLWLECNDLYGNTGGDYGGMVSAGATDFSLDPRFCSASTGNYKIRNDSPCAPGRSPSGCGLVGAGEVGCISIGMSTGPAGGGNQIPQAFFASPARPNPTGGASTVEFGLPRDATVSVEIFDAGGRLVASVLEADMDAGIYTVSWNGDDGDGRSVAPGVFFMRMQAGRESSIQKVTLVRD